MGTKNGLLSDKLVVAIDRIEQTGSHGPNKCCVVLDDQSIRHCLYGA